MLFDGKNSFGKYLINVELLKLCVNLKCIYY